MNQAPKKHPKIYIYPLICNIYILYGVYAVGRPCGGPLQPPIGSSGRCTATRADLEAIVLIDKMLIKIVIEPDTQ